MAKNVNKDLLRYEQEKREFIDGLRNFHYNRGTSFHRTPRCGNADVDLYRLYQKVTSLGGWKKVTEHRQWEEVIEHLHLPKACLSADQALKYCYIRFLHAYEHIHFLGEDPKLLDVRGREDEGPIRKKQCQYQYNVPTSYNQAQHDVADVLRQGFGLSTTFAQQSDYDKLEKALMSGLPNEVDFVINVCTLLSNESKHTLRLERCANLTTLLLAHIGIFTDDAGSLERLYENCWRTYSDRDFIRFWFDTVKDEEARKLISYTRQDKRSLCGCEVLQVGRNLGVEDKEGIRITQVAIIIRNLSFDHGNMKVLANNDLVFRFLLLCIHCEYGTLRQLALDTMGNLSAQCVLDNNDTKSQIILDLLVSCIMSQDKFAVVTGLEMVSKLSRIEDNEYVLSEKLDISVYEAIAKYLTISDIQLIVYSLEALYQLSEIGEQTNDKIVETSNTVDTLISLITVEAQSYGPNSLVGIKVVEYCPPPHLTGGAAESMPGAVGPPTSTAPATNTQAQPPGSSAIPAGKKSSNGDKGCVPDPPIAPDPIETATCNWLQATYEACPDGVVPHISLYTSYLAFCKTFQLSQPQNSQDFMKTIDLVFPKCRSMLGEKLHGGKEMCIQGVRKRPEQLSFSVPTAVQSKGAGPLEIARPGGVSESTVATGVLKSPQLAKRLLSPPSPTAVPRQQSRPLAHTTNPHVYTPGAATTLVPRPPATPSLGQVQTSSGQFPQQQQQVCAPIVHIPLKTTAAASVMSTVSDQIPAASLGSSGATAVSHYSLTGAVSAMGYITDPVPPPISQSNSASTATASKSSKASKKKVVKKNQPVLPKMEPQPGNLPTIMPKSVPVQSGHVAIQPAQTSQVTIQQPQVVPNPQIIQNVQIATQDVMYQAIDQNNPENKVKTLLAQKIRTGHVIIQQQLPGGMVSVQNVDLGGASEGQTIQYQTGFPPPGQQAAYIQYATPAVSSQSNVQTIIQPANQATSQVQTFVVQPNGEMYMQGQMAAPSVATAQQLMPQQQIVVSQHPMMGTQQHIMVPQQPLLVSQQPMVVSQQPMVVSQQQFIPQLAQQPQSASQLVHQKSPFMAQSHATTAILPPTSQVLLQQPSVGELPTQQHFPTLQSSSSSTTMFVSSSSLPVCTMASLPAAVTSSIVLQHSSSIVSSTHSSPQVTAITSTANTTSIHSTNSASQDLHNSSNETGARQPGNGDGVREMTMGNSTDTVLMNQSEHGSVGQRIEITKSSESDSSKCDNVAGTVPSNDRVTCSANANNSANSHSKEEGSVSVAQPNSNIDLTCSEQVEEIDAAVGSIMDESQDNDSTAEEEPVMIENDGNELMFEQSKYQLDGTSAAGNRPAEISYAGDEEASLAAHHLSEMTQQDDSMQGDGVLVMNTGEDQEQAQQPISEGSDIYEPMLEGSGNDQIPSEQTDRHAHRQGPVEKEGSLEKEVVMSDEELINKFRAETPINVPLVSENGLFEQDFEARMAVENLLKDVEFKVNDADGSEMNVIYACQKLDGTLGSTNGHALEENGSTEMMESQTVAKTTASSVSQKSNTSTTGQHAKVNGLDIGHKPLMNGDISSPECASVPSPGLVNGREKLVNGICEEKVVDKSAVRDKVVKLNGVVNHKISCSDSESKLMEICDENGVDSNSQVADKPKAEADILAQSMMDSNIDKADGDDGDILARSIFENGIEPSDCEMPESEPTSVTAVVKQIIPNPMYGNIMTVQINNNTIPITFTNSPIITSKNSTQITGAINVCSSRHIPTPETARDELSCDSTSSSIATSEHLSVVVSEKHSTQKPAHSKSKESKKSLASPKGAVSEPKKKPSKKRSRTKSGGSSTGGDSRPSSVNSPAAASTPAPEYMCEWSECRQCFDSARKVYHHVCHFHLKTEYDGLCKWEGCESLVRRRWSLFTHVQDHHCSENSLRVACQRRLQSFQTGQKIAAPTIPAMVYPKDAANQAIKRFLAKPPYPEFTEGREGPVTKHIRLTSALILRNVARYSREGRSILKKHERIISYTCMSAVESSTALSNCLYELMTHK